jgi:hypothetical protein
MIREGLSLTSVILDGCNVPLRIYSDCVLIEKGYGKKCSKSNSTKALSQETLLLNSL